MPVSLISPFLRHINLHKGLHSGRCLPLSVWTYHHITSVAGPKRHTFNPHPSNLHPYHLHPSIMSDINLFRAFMNVVKNSSALMACSSRYNVCSRIIKNLLDEYAYHQLLRTRQEKKPLVDTNNQNQITRWAQEQLDVNHSNQPYTNWGLLTACQIRVLSNTSYDQLKSEYGISKIRTSRKIGSTN